MARVLFVGQQPETVDFTNPMLPPGMNAERIHAGITLALKQMAERGWHADLCLLDTGARIEGPGPQPLGDAGSLAQAVDGGGRRRTRARPFQTAPRPLAPRRKPGAQN